MSAASFSAALAATPVIGGAYAAEALLRARLATAPTARPVNPGNLANWMPTAPPGWQWRGPVPTSAAPNPQGSWISPDGKEYKVAFGNYPWASVGADVVMLSTVRTATVPPADPVPPSPVALVPPPPPAVGAVPSPVALNPPPPDEKITPAGPPPASSAPLYIALGVVVLALGVFVVMRRP